VEHPTHTLSHSQSRTHHLNTAVVAAVPCITAAAAPSPLTFRPLLLLLLPCADLSTTNTTIHASNIRFSTLAHSQPLHLYPPTRLARPLLIRYYCASATPRPSRKPSTILPPAS
jgi:hypothetical protein